MRTHRFYIEDITKINPGEVFVTQETDLIHQLKNVFRFKIGQKVVFFNQNVGEIEFELVEMGKKDMSFMYIRHINSGVYDKNSKKQVCLYMSIIKNSNFDLVVEKAVELGVDKIIPITTERTIKNDLNLNRLNKIIKEATEQSGRLDLMIIENVMSFEDSIEKSIKENDAIFFGSIDSDNKTNRVGCNKIAVFIGPEGGFSGAEVDILIEKGVEPVRLGSYVLRAETAAIVACGVLSL
jgi:16S rRNA (uracil1498-N3)-methyltransferase